jgi:DNA primase
MTKAQNQAVAKYVNQRVDLLDMIKGHGFEPWEDATGKLRMKCPLHNEKTASFFIYPNNSFYCFGCASGGGVVQFIMEYDSKSYDEVIDMFRDDTDVTSDQFLINSVIKNLTADKFKIIQHKNNMKYQLGIFLRKMLYKDPSKKDLVFSCYKEMDMFFGNDQNTNEETIDDFVEKVMDMI